jgi:hypothetical protein
MSTRPTVLHTKKGYGMKIFVVTRLSSQARQTHLPLKVKCKGHNFFQIYTFLDSDFSTLIENHNNFQFSQAVCAKSTGKLTCFKPNI